MAAELFPKHRVYVATKPLDPIEIDDVPIDDLSTVDDTQWRMLPHLICERVVEGLMPTLSQATLLWRFGNLRREWGVGSVVPGVSTPINLSDEFSDYRAKLDLRGKYVMITLVDPDKKWIFYVAEENEIRSATNVAVTDSEFIKYGDQTFTAFDLSYFLAKQQIAGTSSVEADKVKRPIDYNAGCGEGRDPDPAKRANRKDTDSGDLAAAPYNTLKVYEFDFGPDAVLWTALDATVHLLKQQCPRDQADAVSPVIYLLDPAAIPFLNWYTPTTQGIEGRSVLEALDQLIDRRRCLTAWWTTEMAGLASDVLACILHVSSLAATSLDLPEMAVLPPASTTATFEPDDYALSQPPQISRGKRKYHRVRVRGARRTSTFSAIAESVAAFVPAPVINSRIVNTWSAADETAYEQGIRPIMGDTDYLMLTEPEKKTRNDRYREQPRFERVYQYFAVTAATAADGGEISPIIVQSTGSTVGNLEVERRVVRLESRTQLRTGFDYEDATAPTPNGNEDYGEEFLHPFAAFYLPEGALFTPSTLGTFTAAGEDPATSTDGGWRLAETLSQQEERGFIADDALVLINYRFKASFHLSVLSAEAGFKLSPNGSMMPHYISGQPDWSLPGGHDFVEPSRYPVDLWWGASLLITSTVEWDAFCEAVWPEAVPTASPVMELLIQVSDRNRHDWLAKGTVYNLDLHGNLMQVQTGGALRDDRKQCEIVARLAHLWYSQDRAGLLLAFDNLVAPFDVGDLITTLGTGAAEETVNAVVSQIQYDLANGKTTITCGYQELDFDNIV